MPYLGLFPFLQARRNREAWGDWEVSMPYLGLFPFLHGYIIVEGKGWSLFQCPISGYSHFYFRVHDARYGFSRCFNALSRAIPISTWVHSWRERLVFHVSMPYLGLFPFLRYALQRRINTAFREPFLRVIHRIFWQFHFTVQKLFC